MSKSIIRAVQSAVQLIGRDLSADALEIFVSELLPYGEAAALAAIERTRREVSHRFTIADVLDRMPNGHPGAEEAWATVSKGLNDEDETLVMTEPMRVAFSAALNLQSDEIAARQAFKEVYQREVAQARARRDLFPRFSVSLGHDAQRREVKIKEAVIAGKLAAERAAPMIGYDPVELKALEPPKEVPLIGEEKKRSLTHAPD